MKHLLLLTFSLLSAGAFSQNTWNQRLPFNNFGSSIAYVDAVPEGDGFLLCGGVRIAELDKTGLIMGRATIPTGLYYSNFVRRTYDDATGKMFFLSGMRKASTSVYALRYFSPEQGFLGEIALPDSLGSSINVVPKVLELDDSTTVVFGRNAAYKLRSHDHSTFSILWQKQLSNLGGVCKAAVEVNEQFVLFTGTGDVIGVNSAGQQTFTRNHPFAFNAAAILPDGIIACGVNSEQKAVLIKLTFAGDLVWSKVYAHKIFNDIALAADGGFVATGKSEINNVVLVKTDADGELLWSQEYQPGSGAKVLALQEGGYFIMAVTTAPSSGAFGIKTDNLGATAAANPDYFVQNRRIETPFIQATIEPSAALFFNGTEATLVSPADSGTATILSFSPWIGGIGDDGQLHLAAENYFGSLYNDFHPGVVDGADSDFKRVWLARKSDVMAMRRDFLTDQVLDAAVPYDLRTWPAKGNIHNRYNVDFTRIQTDPDLQSAPFVDVNGDAVYNVFDGDYPRIKGDQMAWWMVNEDSTHAYSGGLPLKLDISFSAYLYDCPQNESVKNSLFVDVDIINRSISDYDSTYLGFWTDFDLGCYMDDFIGSIPDANSFYAYNQDAIDADCAGVQGFWDDIPVQSVTFQNHELNHFMYANHPLGPSDPAQTDPSAPKDFYNLLQAKWLNDSLLTWGGTGYNYTNQGATTHAFPSNPSDPAGWSMCTVNLPNLDRRSVSSHGPFLFPAGETFHMSVAFTTHHSIPHPCPDVFGLVKPAIEQINAWGNEGVLEQSANLGVVQTINPGQTLLLGVDIPDAMFQWSTGATSPTISVTQPGEYMVTVTNQAGCETVESVLVTTASGTVAPMQTTNWIIYPNPAADVIGISCKECVPGDELQVVLRNAQGVALKHAYATANLFQMDLQGLSSGLYWLEIWQGKISLGSKKFSHVAR